MPDILLKAVPKDIHRRLKERAARNGRSMNREAIRLIERGLTQPARPREFPPALKGSLSSPLAPLTVTVPAFTVTVTPAGTSITRFATLDMATSR